MNQTAGIALGLCGLLAGGCFFPNFAGLGDDPFPIPTVLATYTAGSAELRVTQGAGAEQVVLDEIGRGSTLNSLEGAGVTWRNEAGWSVQVIAYNFDSLLAPVASGRPTASGSSEGESYSGDLKVQRIAGNEFWIARASGQSGNRCIVDIAEASASLIRGSATCRGLRWEDGTAPEMFIDPVYIEDQQPFDVEVTFEATP
jgi:hypothetical protein